MKFILTVLVVCSAYTGFSQIAPDAIVGKWMKIPKQDLVIEVYKVKNEYKGRIKWAQPNDRKKPTGFIILDHLQYNRSTNSWEKGKIHDPNSSSVYTAAARIKSKDILEVTGYKGFKFFGVKKLFKRVNE